MEKIIELRGAKYLIRTLHTGHKRDVYDLYCQCDDYFDMVEDQVADGGHVKELFEALPPGKHMEDKKLYGLFHQRELVGVVDLVKDYPEEGEWIIGLMLMHPGVRDMGLGQVVHKIIVDLALEKGAGKLRVGVVEQNVRGINFWKRLGYEEISRTPPRLFGKKTSVVIVMNYLLKP